MRQTGFTTVASTNPSEGEGRVRVETRSRQSLSARPIEASASAAAETVRTNNDVLGTAAIALDDYRTTPVESAAASATAVELTILMPCLNEAATLEGCIRQAQQFLHDHHVGGEVLIADNGSDDDSQELAERLGARIVAVPNRGYGAAIRGGSLAAGGRFIAVGDADGSYDFSTLAPFLERLREGFDLVLGNRFQGGIEPGAMPWKNRYLGNPVLSGIGRLLFRCPVGDFHCGLRAYSKEAFERMGLQTSGMELASEMPIRAGLLGMKVTEVPTKLYPDGRTRRPHLRPWRDGWRHLCYMIRAWATTLSEASSAIGADPRTRFGSVSTMMAVLALSVGCGRRPEAASFDLTPVSHGSTAPDSQTPLRFATNRVDLGLVPPGGRAQKTVLLRNESAVPLVLARIESSCDCVKVEWDKGKIEPFGQVPLLVTCDLSGDAQFTGELLMGVQGFDSSGALIASLNVTLTADPTAQALSENRQ